MRGVYVRRDGLENIGVSNSLDRYPNETTPTKTPTTQQGNIAQATQLKSKLGEYSLAILNSNQIAEFRDKRIKDGKSNNTVRL